MWYTCTGPCRTPRDGLDGFSTPKNPQFDTSHSSVASTNQKLGLGGVAVGVATGTCDSIRVIFERLYLRYFSTFFRTSGA